MQIFSQPLFMGRNFNAHGRGEAFADTGVIRFCIPDSKYFAPTYSPPGAFKRETKAEVLPHVLIKNQSHRRFNLLICEGVCGMV